MANEYERAFRQLFREYGVTDYRFIKGKNHPKVEAFFEGRRFFTGYPASGSDAYRGVLNATTAARRYLGLNDAARSAKGVRPAKVAHPHTPCSIKQPRAPLVRGGAPLAELPASTWREALAALATASRPA